LVCRTYILPEDLEHFLEPEKAQQAFDILDVDGDGQVTLHNIRDAVVTIYQVSMLICISIRHHPDSCLCYYMKQEKQFHHFFKGLAGKQYLMI